MDAGVSGTSRTLGDASTTRTYLVLPRPWAWLLSPAPPPIPAAPAVPPPLLFEAFSGPRVRASPQLGVPGGYWKIKLVEESYVQQRPYLPRGIQGTRGSGIGPGLATAGHTPPPTPAPPLSPASIRIFVTAQKDRRTEASQSRRTEAHPQSILTGSLSVSSEGTCQHPDDVKTWTAI